MRTQPVGTDVAIKLSNMNGRLMLNGVLKVHGTLRQIDAVTSKHGLYYTASH